MLSIIFKIFYWIPFLSRLCSSCLFFNIRYSCGLLSKIYLGGFVNDTFLVDTINPEMFMWSNQRFIKDVGLEDPHTCSIVNKDFEPFVRVFSVVGILVIFCVLLFIQLLFKIYVVLEIVGIRSLNLLEIRVETRWDVELRAPENFGLDQFFLVFQM